uniref:Uncharacterized protein n=1 Tax=Erwinia amylovora ATCC BAA-2158 TaxID=889211 RepID=E5B6N6_ERWAM|nr:hypothetical protein predicted by Glimmer/Critica [Erwinia amylovora ATCC BAA-2158]
MAERHTPYALKVMLWMTTSRAWRSLLALTAAPAMIVLIDCAFF